MKDNSLQPEIIFHIGTGKTGTTAIQNTLHANRSDLQKKHGILYPVMKSVPLIGTKKIPANHCAYFNTITNEYSEERISTFSRDLDDVLRTAKKKNAKTIVFSCESIFQRSKVLPPLFSNALKDLKAEKVRFILYLRRQDLLLESAWKQWGTKNPDYETIQDYMGSRHVQNLLDFKSHLDRWLTYFEADQFQVHTFEKSHLRRKSVIPSFFQQLGLSDSTIKSLQKPSIRKSNTGYSDDVLHLLRLYKQDDIHDNTLHKLLNRALPEKYLKQDPFQNYGILELSEREELLEIYRADNQSIANTFFTDGREDLFLDDGESLNKESNKNQSHNHENELEKLFPILLDLFIHQEERLRRIESRHRKIFSALPLPKTAKSRLRKFLKSL
ncbi:MAG: hypothetical protein DA446_07885 [Bacteroidetes bacterium]|nr:MAG: hypothetical protein DA446_07885 [Bacteroidota bacterium]